jgi:DNA-binding NtrC family response regulator
LEESEVERVGGTKTIPVNVRVIAATNKDLPEAIQNGNFREDLYYRLNVVPIAVPPLRARADDIPELVEHFRSSLALETARTIPAFEPDALAALQRWSWPGNVRELRNVVERLTIMTDAERIRAGDVVAVLQGARAGSSPSGAVDAATVASGGSLREILEDTERRLIEQALDASAGVISEAARSLGMDRANLHRKMRRLGIDRADAEVTERSGSDAE